MPDDAAPTPDTEPAAVTPALQGEPESQSTTETVTEVTKRPAEPTDDLVTTAHTLRVGRRTLRYTAVTGRLVLREEVYEDGVFKGFRPKAEVSVTTYVLDGAKPADRPVTFAFNGGPGSSSVWLHLGLLGPRRVVMGDVGDLLPPPYGLADNAESLLAVSDLVFVDPVSTGYSRAVEGGKPEPYHGFQGDLESVAEVIRLWTARNNRWMSPKFLAGESYGTLRAAALAEHLQGRYGMYLNGVMLISSVLDLSSIDFEKQRNDRAHALYLPTYAAVSHFHGRQGRRGLRALLTEAEAYAGRDYPWVLSRGDRLTAAERAEAVTTIARLSGLSEDYVDRADLRIEHLRFFAELLRDQRLVVGRLDSRFTGPAESAIAELTEIDPSYDAIVGPYAAAFNAYVRDELALSERPALRADHVARAPVVVQGVRGPAGGRVTEPRTSPAAERPPQGARRLRPLRRRDAVLRRRGRRGAPADPRRPQDEHRARVLRRGPHDVRPRAVAAAAERRPRRLREASQRRVIGLGLSVWYSDRSIPEPHLRARPSAPRVVEMSWGS